MVNIKEPHEFISYTMGADILSCITQQSASRIMVNINDPSRERTRDGEERREQLKSNQIQPVAFLTIDFNFLFHFGCLEFGCFGTHFATIGPYKEGEEEEKEDDDDEDEQEEEEVRLDKSKTQVKQLKLHDTAVMG